MGEENTEKGLTQKQENFARIYVENGKPSEAYKQAYDAQNMTAGSIAVEASRLLQNPNVALRVEELQEEARQRTLVTVESITRELEEIRSKALQSEEYSPAVAATMGKAKVNGLLVDRSEIAGKNGGAIKTEHIIVSAEVVKNVMENINQEI